MGLKQIEIVLVKNKSHQIYPSFPLPPAPASHFLEYSQQAAGWEGFFSPGVLSVIYKALMKNAKEREEKKNKSASR